MTNNRLNNSMADFLRVFLFVLGLMVGSPAVAFDQAERDRLDRQEQERHEARWAFIVDSQFGGRSIGDAEGILELKAPVVPADPAVVPISVHAKSPQTVQSHITRITLLVDHNPAPLAAVFHLGVNSGMADIATRVRVAEYSNVRAVAEFNDGRLVMAKRFVKASGGCDVSPFVDQQEVMNRIGTMKLRLPGGPQPGKPSRVDLMIDHPNYNGMQVSNTPGVYLPVRMLKTVEVSYAGAVLMRIDGHDSLSHDPQFRFFYVPEGPGALSVRALDSARATFEQSWPVVMEGADSR